jgi:acetoin utilization protein AcuC
MTQAVAEVALVAGERLARYGFPAGHPFGPDRHAAFMREFDSRGLRELVRMLEPVQATSDDLLLFHTNEHVQFVRERSESGIGTLDGGDTPAYRGVFEAASCVVGASLLAMDWIMAGTQRRAFVPIAGLHHATRERAAGFCVFNDCGVVIEALRRRHGLQRVAYVDIDAHHGDGVYYAFEDDPDVIIADLHESGHSLYPGTGHAEETGRHLALGTKRNFPLAAGADDGVFADVWEHALLHVSSFDADFIILQCGADSIAGDPLTHLQFSCGAHARAAADLTRLAQKQGHGRVLALGGGGYDRRNLSRAWCDVLAALIEPEAAPAP